MGRLIAALYDRLTQTSEAACLRQWRAELLGDLVGHVLEVGAGTGLNLPHYPRTLSRLVLSEPDPHMRSKLAQRARTLQWHKGEVLDGSLEALPHPAATFDAVVGTLVLCSVPRLDYALEEVYRVLKPGGHFVFLEHVAADDRPRRLRWQRRIEPIWKRLGGNCHLTRRTGEAILTTGFEIVHIKRESMRKALPLVRPTIRGVAVKPERVVDSLEDGRIRRVGV